MRKTLTAIAAAATLTLATVAAPQHAEARNGRIAAGIIGGLAVGALIGAAAANGPYAYAPGPAYYYTVHIATGAARAIGTDGAGTHGGCASAASTRSEPEFNVGKPAFRKVPGFSCGKRNARCKRPITFRTYYACLFHQKRNRHRI